MNVLVGWVARVAPHRRYAIGIALIAGAGAAWGGLAVSAYVTGNVVYWVLAVVLLAVQVATGWLNARIYAPRPPEHERLRA